MTKNLEQYKDTAWTMFALLTDTPGVIQSDGKDYSIFDNDNYWRVGNVVDTITDYLLVALASTDPLRSFTPQQSEALMTRIYDYYLTIKGCWYDDFAWWGIVGAKAFDKKYATVFGNTADSFQSLALNCWELVQNGKGGPYYHGAPHVFEHCDKNYFAGVAPKYDGGVWQYEIAACRIPGDCSFSDKAPTPIKLSGISTECCYDGPQYLGPFQLSVVNGLYLLLASRLAAAGKLAGSYATNVATFIDSWCNKETNPDTSLLDTYGRTDSGLIRERVSEYKNGDPVYTYDARNAWAGDQGLFIGALYDYSQFVAAPQALALARKIVVGSMQNLGVAYIKGDRRVLAPYLPYASPLSPFTGDTDDYASGIGVLARYLRYVYGKDEDMTKAMNGTEFTQLIYNTADGAVEDLLPPTNVNIFAAFNRLATLMLAISVLENKPE